MGGKDSNDFLAPGAGQNFLVRCENGDYAADIEAARGVPSVADFPAALDAPDDFLDRGRLVAARLVVGDHLERRQAALQVGHGSHVPQRKRGSRHCRGDCIPPSRTGCDGGPPLIAGRRSPAPRRLLPRVRGTASPGSAGVAACATAVPA